MYVDVLQLQTLFSRDTLPSTQNLKPKDDYEHEHWGAHLTNGAPKNLVVGIIIYIYVQHSDRQIARFSSKIITYKI